MKPYQNIKLDSYPDVADGQAQGRKSTATNVSVRGGKARANQVPRHKATARRALKRAATARRIRKEIEDHV